jgi:hypothetical protein
MPGMNNLRGKGFIMPHDFRVQSMVVWLDALRQNTIASGVYGEVFTSWRQEAREGARKGRGTRYPQ